MIRLRRVSAWHLFVFMESVSGCVWEEVQTPTAECHVEVSHGEAASFVFVLLIWRVSIYVTPEHPLSTMKHDRISEPRVRTASSGAGFAF